MSDPHSYSKPSFCIPDIQLHFFRFSSDLTASPIREKWLLPGVDQMRPESRRTVRVASNNANDAPPIDPNYQCHILSESYFRSPSRELFTIFIEHCTFLTSQVFIVVSARLAGMDYSLEQASADLGDSPEPRLEELRFLK